MIKMSKQKWKWIKFWGYHYIMKYPNKADVEYIIYHRKIYDVYKWDRFFEF